MKVLGGGHLAEVMRTVLRSNYLDEIAFIAHDIVDHQDKRSLCEVAKLLLVACEDYPILVVVSQVPPGWTRANTPTGTKAVVFYQADTIVVRNAVDRLLRPEQFIIGCANPSTPLPIPYQAYLATHDCPIHQMSYESAELAKCAINYALGAQMKTANRLAEVSRYVGANYANVEKALRGDRRIGPHAYVTPGSPNQHLDRDILAIESLLCSR